VAPVAEPVSASTDQYELTSHNPPLAPANNYDKIGERHLVEVCSHHRKTRREMDATRERTLSQLLIPSILAPLTAHYWHLPKLLGGMPQR
jgi:hypothetical protein